MSIKFLKQYINRLKYNIWSYFWYKSPIYINLNFTKIFWYWWKCRRDFLKPVIVKHKLKRGDCLNSDYFYLNTDVNNKLLHIDFHPLDWKTKYGDYRFEGVPYIIIVLKNKAWVWGLEAPLWEQLSNHSWQRNNMLYWEGILDYRYTYNKNIIKTYQNNIWVRHYNVQDLRYGNNKELELQDTLFQSLTETGKQIIKSHIDFLNSIPPPKKKNKNKDEESS